MSSANSGASRDEQLSAVLASPPPRVLPKELRQAAMRQAAPLSFAVFGALFGGFGLIFVLIFFPWRITRDWRLLEADTVQVPGKILDTVETKLRINEKPVVLYAFEFRTVEGVPRRGECYTSGTLWKQGKEVEVRYRPEEPSIAAPVGARLSRTGVGSMFVALFPLGGAGLVLWVLISRHRSLQGFIHGRVIEAFVTDIEHTQTMINDYPLYKITFERPDAPYEPPILLRHWKPKVVAFLTIRRETKQAVFLLGDPRTPSNFLLPESL